ncbi:MAG TPA: DUF3105 domain-containing protein [Myxococcota bacterium]|nr:DUF3105 domain-containing protein [Myxococcota bacterium]
MKPHPLLFLLALFPHSPACEVAELPPLVEVRDARDATQADTATDSAEPDTSADTETADDTTADTTNTDLGDTDSEDSDSADSEPGDTDSAEADTIDADSGDTDLADTDPTDTDPADTDPGDTNPGDTGDTAQLPTCTPVVATHPIVASPHVTTCSAVTYETDPPTSGPHYPVWAAFKTYGAAINPGFLVHAQEHGAIVITWRCDDGCEASLAALQAMLDARAADPLCDPLVKHRVIVAPRPTQDTTLVAAGWGASWKADCFDLASLSDFIDAWYAKGPENFCAQGVDIETILPDNAWYCPP